MTLEEVLNQVGGDSDDAHITYEEAKMAYDSDKELAHAVDETVMQVWSRPDFALIAMAVYEAGIKADEFARIIMRAIVEILLTDKD